MKKKILYFYEYASEIRGKCVGHARIVACPGRLNISLAFSLQGWDKTESSVYIIGETWEGECEAVFAGKIMPSEILTVYNLNVEFSEFKKLNIMTAEAIGVMVIGKGKYIKALSGDMIMTELRLSEIIGDGDKLQNEEKSGKGEDNQEVNGVTGDENNTDLSGMFMKDAEIQVRTEKKADLMNQNGSFIFREQDNKYERESLDKEVCAANETSIYSDVNNSLLNTEESAVIRKKENIRQSVKSIVTKSERLLAFRTEYNPFENGRVSRCVRIGVGDINTLAEEEPGLKENSFLMHGFYRYKHLLLAKKENSGRTLFLILVPGLKTDKEQRLADMYGFHDFVTLDGCRARQGVFGYFVWKLTFSP